MLRNKNHNFRYIPSLPPEKKASFSLKTNIKLTNDLNFTIYIEAIYLLNNCFNAMCRPAVKVSKPTEHLTTEEQCNVND